MKASAVVQGFKDLASRLHGQLPLTPRESQRLLTALTGSFRKHLDEVHPLRASENGRPTTSGTLSKKPSDGHDLHSSAFLLADKHMASVLTNPLLARNAVPKKPELDAVTAAAELEAGADPLELLERYEKKSCATFEVAQICVSALQRTLLDLDHEAQVAEIQREDCLLYTSPSPRDGLLSRMPSSA